MTFVEDLNSTLVPKLVGMREAWSDYRKELDEERMIRILMELYHYIRHSVPLMELAASKCRDTNPATADYFLHHVEEEKDHDVWLLEDLESINISSEKVREALPMKPTLGMVATQYYIIDHINPVGLLGYMYILEGMVPTGERVKEYGKRAGIPESALRTMLEHAVLDPHHIEDMRQALSVEELSEKDQELIRYNAVSTVEYLAEIYRSLDHGMRTRGVGPIETFRLASEVNVG